MPYLLREVLLTPRIGSAGSGLAIMVAIGWLWVSEALHVTVTALLGPLLAAASGVLALDLADPVIFLFLGGFALAAGLQKQGLDRWMAAWVIGKAGNRLDIALLVPLFIGMAPQIGDVSIAVVVAMACSCAFLLPVATSPNAIISGSGCVPQRQMIRCGLWVSLLILPVLFGVAAVLR